ncbi:hypothetical protein [Novosphingobium beihaiensis]|uniref:Uncharacterized protein n=1 Tax=Novosphingobium beihaiensis TaxID=2930389 RepID=A0ABT0BSW8_9SPHN|nr:hypothetical protein [Novosphingobium beihaiensis]MCJ2188132.1 hypothetical protein [Novosphingobium beihaiensis]
MEAADFLSIPDFPDGCLLLRCNNGTFVSLAAHPFGLTRFFSPVSGASPLPDHGADDKHKQELP